MVNTEDYLYSPYTLNPCISHTSFNFLSVVGELGCYKLLVNCVWCMKTSTCGTPELMKRSTCGTPALMKKSTCGTPALMKRSTCGTPALMKRSTCGTPALMKKMCNAPFWFCVKTHVMKICHGDKLVWWLKTVVGFCSNDKNRKTKKLFETGMRYKQPISCLIH